MSVMIDGMMIVVVVLVIVCFVIVYYMVGVSSIMIVELVNRVIMMWKINIYFICCLSFVFVIIRVVMVSLYMMIVVLVMVGGILNLLMILLREIGRVVMLKDISICVRKRLIIGS